MNILMYKSGTWWEFPSGGSGNQEVHKKGGRFTASFFISMEYPII